MNLSLMNAENGLKPEVKVCSEYMSLLGGFSLPKEMCSSIRMFMDQNELCNDEIRN